MDVFEALYTTRAMRRVTEEPISDEILKQMVDAAVRAQSGANTKSWKFLVITDSKIKNLLGDLYREAWDFYIKEYYENNPDMGASKVLDEKKADQVVRISKSATWLSENFHKVPAQFVILSRNDPTGSSIYPAIWNLMLAGRAHWVGTCLTTVLGMFNQEKTFDALVIPTDKGWQINAVVTAGYPLGKWGVAKREPIENVTFLNTWGNKPGWNLEDQLFNY